MKERQNGSTTHPMPFLMVSSTDHINGVPSITPTVTISKDGGTFAAPAGAVTEVGSGWYVLAGNATDRNTNGTFLIHATGTGVDPSDTLFTIVPWDPFDAVRMGLTALPPSGTLAVNPTINATQVFNNTGQTTKLAATLAAADVSGNLPAAVTDKTGYALSAAGLDQISVVDPGGVANMTTLPKMLVALWRRAFKKSTLSAAAGLKLYADDNTAVNTTQTAADDGTVQTLGPAT